MALMTHSKKSIPRGTVPHPPASWSAGRAVCPTVRLSRLAMTEIVPHTKRTLRYRGCRKSTMNRSPYFFPPHLSNPGEKRVYNGLLPLANCLSQLAVKDLWFTWLLAHWSTSIQFNTTSYAESLSSSYDISQTIESCPCV